MAQDRYYSTDLKISIGEIKAESKEQAEAIMNEFIDKIGEIMADQISWDECDWEIEVNTLDESKGEWVSTWGDDNE